MIPKSSFETTSAFQAFGQDTPQNLSATQNLIHNTEAQNYQTVMENSQAGIGNISVTADKPKSLYSRR